MARPMKISFVSGWPVNSTQFFSGIPYYMAKAFRALPEFDETIEVPQGNIDLKRKGTTRENITEIVKAGDYLSQSLKKSKTDVVICLGSHMIPYLETDKPIILWHDSNWFGLMNMDFHQFTTHNPILFELDKLTLEKCKLVIFAADWLRDLTLANYDIASEKIHVVPFGANLEDLPEVKREDLLANRDPNHCQLTFIGKEWARKGLPIAVNLNRELNHQGLKTTLNVIGNTIIPYNPSLRRKLATFFGLRKYSEIELFRMKYQEDLNVKKYGFLDKADPTQYLEFEKVVRRSHFLIHPARFECYGIVMAEANARSVPVLATNKYGPKTIVRDGVNGFLFDQTDFVRSAATTVLSLMNDYPKYLDLAAKSYHEYKERLNWTVAVNKVVDLIKSYC